MWLDDAVETFNVIFNMSKTLQVEDINSMVLAIAQYVNWSGGISMSCT